MLDKYTVPSDCTVKFAIEKMQREIIKAVVVISEDYTVQGLFANGDMRKFFLKGGSLYSCITDAMNPSPVLYHSFSEIKKENIKRVIYPIVNDANILIDVLDETYSSNANANSSALKDVPLVIMAGGKGTRLYPYTKILPKPLIPIGDITITERIIGSFEKYGCSQVYMILNHKANMIKAYINDLEKHYQIDYVIEQEFLGTGGGLRLIKNMVNTTFFLSNCDILINDDLECIYRTHKLNENKITFVCSMKDVMIPYGVVETNEAGFITEMKEKPEFSWLVNTGLYVIEPDVLDDIKEGEFIHLPDLAMRYIARGEKVGVFPIAEKSWMDMGQFSEMQSMIERLGINQA